MTAELMQAELAKIKQQAHRNCVVCSPSNMRGLRLEFILSKDGHVEASFGCDKTFEGYPNVLHGGVVSSLLDGAMTNCLFAHGYIAVTVELKVRFQHPVVVAEPITARAWIVQSCRRLHVVKAEVSQNRKVKATAVAKFLENPRPEKKEVRGNRARHTATASPL